MDIQKGMRYRFWLLGCLLGFAILWGAPSVVAAQSDVQLLTPPLVDGEPVEVYVELYNVTIKANPPK